MTVKLLIAVLILAQAMAAAETTIELDPARSTVKFSVGSTLHTVHGTFKVKRGTIHFDSETGLASGEIVVDTASGISGDEARDYKMQKEVLDSLHFPEAALVVDRVTGALAPRGESQLDVHGVLGLHGTSHEMTLHFAAEVNGSEISATTRFTIPYVQWGMKNPGNFLLKVKDKVEVEVKSVGRIAIGAAH